MKKLLSEKRGGKINEYSEFEKKNYQSYFVIPQEKYNEALVLVDEILCNYKYVEKVMILKGELCQEADGKSTSLEESLSIFEDVLKINENSTEALIEAAYYHYAIEDNSRKALEYFEKAIISSRDFYKSAFLGKVKALNDLGEKNKAKKALSIFKKQFLEFSNSFEVEEVEKELQ